MWITFTQCFFLSLIYNMKCVGYVTFNNRVVVNKMHKTKNMIVVLYFIRVVERNRQSIHILCDLLYKTLYFFLTSTHTEH